MRIVLDTNVVASGIFFGGKPGRLLDMVLRHQVEAVATNAIFEEYQETLDYLLERYGGTHLHFSTLPLFASMELIPQSEKIQICLDPDDDKFLSCAVDGHCLYVVSGDKDLLTLKRCSDVEIITVAQFFDRLSHLSK